MMILVIVLSLFCSTGDSAVKCPTLSDRIESQADGQGVLEIRFRRLFLNQLNMEW